MTPDESVAMTDEEQLIASRLSRRAFVGATAGATLAALVGHEPRLVHAQPPPAPEPPMPRDPVLTGVTPTIDRVFRYALGRPPSAAERRAAEEALRDPARGSRPSAQGLADLLWAVMMKPEFQLIY